MKVPFISAEGDADRRAARAGGGDVPQPPPPPCVTPDGAAEAAAGGGGEERGEKGGEGEGFRLSLSKTLDAHLGVEVAFLNLQP